MSDNVQYLSFWVWKHNTTKMALRGRFIALCTYIQYFEISQINNLMVHLQTFKRQEKIKSLYSIPGEIIKIKTKINKTEANWNQLKIWFFAKISQDWQGLSQISNKIKKTQITETLQQISKKFRKSKGTLYKPLFHDLQNLKEMGECLVAYNVRKVKLRWNN